MIVQEDVFIGKLVEQLESMLNPCGMRINQKRPSRMTRVKLFGILLYRQTILTTSKRSDMIFTDKDNHEQQIIYFAIPYDTTADDKEVEKIKKQLTLVRELKKVWTMKVAVVLLVVRALGTPAKALKKRLKTIGIETKITELQKTVLTHTTKIL